MRSVVSPAQQPRDCCSSRSPCEAPEHLRPSLFPNLSKTTTRVRLTRINRFVTCSVLLPNPATVSTALSRTQGPQGVIRGGRLQGGDKGRCSSPQLDPDMGLELFGPGFSCKSLVHRSMASCELFEWLSYLRSRVWSPVILSARFTFQTDRQILLLCPSFRNIR